MKTKYINSTVKCAIICSILSMSSVNLIAQTTAQFLEAHIWEQQFPSPVGFSFTVNFNNTSWVNKFDMDDKKEVTNEKYFLSDTIETIFDYDKIGKIDNGRYVIVEQIWKTDGKPYIHLGVFEIITLDSANLVLKNLRNNSILTYKALK